MGELHGMTQPYVCIQHVEQQWQLLIAATVYLRHSTFAGTSAHTVTVIVRDWHHDKTQSLRVMIVGVGEGR